MEEKVTKKSNKKVLIISIIAIIVVLILAVVGGMYLYNNKKDNGTNWEKSYFNALKKDSTENTIRVDRGQGFEDTKVDYYADAENIKLQFIQIEENSFPIMAVKFDYKNVDRINFYALIEKDDGNNYVRMSQNPAIDYTNESLVKQFETNEIKVKLLYNIEQNEYKWYYINEIEDSVLYRELGGFTPIENSQECRDAKEYRFKKSEMTVDKVSEDGTPMLSEYEKTFIEIYDLEENMIDVNELHNISEELLKEKMQEAKDKYKDRDSIVTEEVKADTENKVTQIEDKKEQIKIAEEEKAKKAAKEAEEKAAAEEALKKQYVGTYKNNLGDTRSITMDSNGDLYYTKYKINANVKDSQGRITIYNRDEQGMNFSAFLYPVGTSLSVPDAKNNYKSTATDSSRVRIAFFGTDVADMDGSVYYKVK